MAGGCVCIPSETARLNDLGRAMHSQKVTHALIAPSTARLIIAGKERMPHLETLIMVGEPMSQEDVENWSSTVRLFCCMGSSEASASTFTRVERGFNLETVGKAFPNCRTWIVDPDNQERLVPYGGLGELVMEGPSVAKGYLGDSLKTRASFFHEPVWAKEYGVSSGHSFYKTGDLARYDENGDILLSGRKDAQIKIRGQRVEPGEVEYHIRKIISGKFDVVTTAESTTDLNGLSKTSLVAVLRSLSKATVQQDQHETSGSLSSTSALDTTLSSISPSNPEEAVSTHPS